MPRIYVKKGTRTREVDEDAMKSAMNEVLDKTLSIRKSAQKYGIKPTTLQSRLTNLHKKTAAEKEGNNTPSRVFTSKFTSNQVFTTEEETLLNEYIAKCSKMHYGLTIIQVRRLAYEYANVNQLQYPTSWDHNKMAGKEWLDSYRRRSANLSLRKPENTSAARSFGFNKTAVSDFYDNLEKLLRKYAFPADRIYNFDESGVSTVQSTPKVLAQKNLKQIGQLVSAERGELVTFGGIISASGNTIPPLFIFPRVRFKDYFMEGAPEGSLGMAAKSGWINSSIFVEVLKHIKIKTSCSKENPVLLLVDNHESHVTIEAVDYARDNGIIYLSFPPHTTHRLQPLDVGVFGPFKAKLKIAFNDWHVNNPGKTLNIYNIPKLVKIAYFESFNCKNISNAFAKTGIWPFNKLNFSDEEFAAVQVYHSDSIAVTDDNMHKIIPEDITLSQQDLSSRLPPASASTSSVGLITQQVPSSKLPPASPSTSSVGLIIQQDLSSRLQPASPSTSSVGLITQQDLSSRLLPASPSTSSIGLITPEIIRPYPKVDRNAPKKMKKGKLPGKSRIYTDTPEKNRLIEIERSKKIKKQVQERKQKAKEIKRALNLLPDTNKETKPKKQKKTIETDSEDETDISLRESSCSPFEEMSEGSDIENEIPVITENIKEKSFMLVKFENKKTVLHYIGQVVTKYNPMEYKVSFLRKKLGTWKFVFPNTKDEGTVYLSDVVCVLPPPKSASTARTANIFRFKKDLTMYNVQ